MHACMHNTKFITGLGRNHPSISRDSRRQNFKPFPLMEDEREGDVRVPLVFCVFCLLVTAGGVLLVIYAFVPSMSHPWYPTFAILLVASPWIFWFLTFLYSCLRARIRQAAAAAPDDTGASQISRRSTARNALSSSSKEPDVALV